MAVLVAASPCALAIATPSAVLSGVARAARGGVLIKGGGPLEALGSLNALAFDKTGTDRKSVVEGKSVSVRVDRGGRRILKKQTTTTTIHMSNKIIHHYI